MTATDKRPGEDERALVVGPLAMPGFLLVLIGVRRHRRAFVLAGAVLLGLAIKLVDRPRPSQEDAGPASESESEVSPAQEPPTSMKPPTPSTPPTPPTPSRPSAPPKPPEPRKPKPQAPSTPESPAAESEPAASEPEPDQPEPA